jgi:small ligand-binding sensory domain FIST
VESESGVGVLLASFDRDRTTFLPFHIGSSVDDDSDEGGNESSGDDGSGREDEQSKRRKGSDEIQQLIDRLDDAKSATADSCWKIIFVYVSGSTTLDPDAVLARVQDANPNCIIAGGVSSGGHVRLFSSGQDDDAEQSGDEQKRSPESIAKAKKVLGKRTVRQLRVLITKMIERARSGKGESNIDEFVLNNIDLTKEDIPKKSLVDIAISLGFGQQISAKSPHDGIDLKHVESGIFGVAIGGDGVPVSAVVSRGCRSVISGDVAPQASTWTVSDAAVLRPGQVGHPFYRGDPAGGNESFHVINRVKNRETGEEIDSIDFVLQNRAEFVGMKRNGGDGFDLTMLQSYSVATGHLMLIEMATSPDDAARRGEIRDHRGSQIDLFNLDGQACIEDVGIKLERLKELVAGKRLLAGLMFSCNGRGPGKSFLINEEMCDANAWNNRFPSVPLLGFYAGGEIGPRAMAGNTDIFQRGASSLQGFTAVFVLFVVPKIEMGGLSIDDGPENVDEFMRERKGSSV